MHVCTIKVSKYAAICNYMLEYARIFTYFKGIIANNYTELNNRISRKTKTIIRYIKLMHLQYHQSTNHIIKKINLFRKWHFFRNYRIFHIFIKISFFRLLFEFLKIGKILTLLTRV